MAAMNLMNFSEPRKLTDLHASYLEAEFSPDGQQIAFAAHAQKLTDIYLMNRPNGRFLAFCTGRKPPPPKKNYYWNLYLLNMETGGVQQLPSVDRWNSRPCFSPDGKTLLYISKTDNGNGLFAVDIDTG